VTFLSKMEEMRSKIKKTFYNPPTVCFPLFISEKNFFFSPNPKPLFKLTFWSFLTCFRKNAKMAEISDMKWLFWAKWRKWGPKSKKRSITLPQFAFLCSFLKKTFFFHQTPNLYSNWRFAHFWHVAEISVWHHLGGPGDDS